MKTTKGEHHSRTPAIDHGLAYSEKFISFIAGLDLQSNIQREVRGSCLASRGGAGIPPPY